jgi:ketosteroid isomerase-like protein
VPEESTTPDLVEHVRVIFEAIPPRDWDTILSFYAPDAVWEAAATGIGRFEGHAAIRGVWEDFTGVYEDLQVDLDGGSRPRQWDRPSGIHYARPIRR